MTEAYFIFELTTHCNLNCIYCYNVWKQKESFEHKELTLLEVKKIVENCTDSTSIKGVTLAGGEPLLNKEIFDIAEFLKSKGIKTAITSNGLLLSEANIKRLIDCGVDHFEVSMPTTESDIFNMLCKSSELKSVRTSILNIRKNNVKLTVSGVITSYNYLEVYDIIELSAVFGADYFAFNRFVPGGTGLLHTAELCLDKQQLKQALGEANKAAKEFNIPVVIAIPVEHCLIDTSSFTNLNFGTCVCGDYKWVIDPYGNLRTCEQNPLVIGSLLGTEFKTLVKQASITSFRKDNLNTDCAIQTCYSNCGGGCRYCRL